MINIRNSTNSKEIPDNGNPKKVINIVEKIFDFNKQQKAKGIKILTPKKMLQRFPIAFAQVKAGIKWNEIRQITYSLYQEKEIAKKVYNNIKSSIN